MFPSRSSQLPVMSHLTLHFICIGTAATLNNLWMKHVSFLPETALLCCNIYLCWYMLIQFGIITDQVTTLLPYHFIGINIPIQLVPEVQFLRLWLITYSCLGSKITFHFMLFIWYVFIQIIVISKLSGSWQVKEKRYILCIK